MSINTISDILATGALGPKRLWYNEYSLHHGFVYDKEAKVAEEGEKSKDIIEEGRKYEAVYLGDINTGAVLLGQSIGVINSLKI